MKYNRNKCQVLHLGLRKRDSLNSALIFFLIRERQLKWSAENVRLEHVLLEQ